MDLKLSFFKKHPYFSICFSVFILAFISGRYGILDWHKEIYFNTVIKEGLLRENSLPAILWNIPNHLSHYPVFKATHIFWAIPETMLFSPLSFTLYFLDPIRFQHLHALIFILLGFWAFLSLSKLLNFNREQSLLFEAGIFMSPMMIQHLAVGYSPWICLYLIPGVFYFLIRGEMLLDLLGLALILSLCLLVGGMHPFVLFSALISFWSLIYSFYAKDIKAFIKGIGAILLAVIVSVGRLAPSFVAFSGFQQELLTGYSIRKFLHYALLPPWPWGETGKQFTQAIADNVAAWDGGIYWGPLLLVLFWLRPMKGRLEKSLLVSAGFFSIISFYDSWSLILKILPAKLSATIVSAEKYPYRWMQMGYFLFLLLIVLSEKNWSQKIPKILRSWRVALITLPLCWAFFAWSTVLLKNSNNYPKLEISSYQNLRDAKLSFLDHLLVDKLWTENEKKFLKVTYDSDGTFVEFNSLIWRFLKNFSWISFFSILGIFIHYSKKRVQN
jgi:hypothetical protein